MLEEQAMFDSLAIRDARPLALVKRTFQVVVGAYLVIGLIAGYRKVRIRFLDFGLDCLHAEGVKESSQG